MYTELGKNNIKDVRSEVQKKLEELRELGLDIQMGTIRYDDSSFRVKVTGTLTNSPTLPKLQLASESEIYNPENKGRKVKVHGKIFTFMGVAPNARKNKCIIKTPRNKEYVCPPSAMEWLD